MSLHHTIDRLLVRGGLPEPFPPDPFPTLEVWMHEATKSGKYDDANAMALATSTPDGRPSVRVVLCKAIEPESQSLTFFTNYESRKGLELAANPFAAVCLHWPHAGRQARVEGVVERLTDAENDAYFRTRPLLSRIGAHASRQSSPIAARTELIREASRVAAHACFDGTIERPSHWGGYRLRAECVELWTACEGRLHQRLRWQRTIDPPYWRLDMLSP